MRAEDRASTRTRFEGRCGYCGVREVDVGAPLTVDHFQPRSRGGSDEADNLVYCCHACNEFKGDYWQPGSPRRILHPLRDPIHEHLFEAEDGALHARTHTGAFHIERLRLNRAERVTHRLQLQREAALRAEYQELIQRLLDLQARVQYLSERVEDLEREG